LNVSKFHVNIFREISHGIDQNLNKIWTDKPNSSTFYSKLVHIDKMSQQDVQNNKCIFIKNKLNLEIGTCFNDFRFNFTL
jgi:hypothetical protein